MSSGGTNLEHTGHFMPTKKTENFFMQHTQSQEGQLIISFPFNHLLREVFTVEKSQTSGICKQADKVHEPDGAREQWQPAPVHNHCYPQQRG